jgi:guanosine-3',5'-bis(diphosphate) 3'-pyrophosphohydrolase
VGVIHKITNLISGDLRINIAAMTIEAKEGIFEGNVKVFVKDKEQLEDLVQHLLDLSGIERVERYNPDDRNQNNNH